MDEGATWLVEFLGDRFMFVCDELAYLVNVSVSNAVALQKHTQVNPLAVTDSIYSLLG